MSNLNHCQGLGYLMGLNFCKTYYNVMAEEMAVVSGCYLHMNDTDTQGQIALVIAFNAATKEFKRDISKHHFKASFKCVEVEQEGCVAPSVERVDHHVCCAVEG